MTLYIIENLAMQQKYSILCVPDDIICILYVPRWSSGWHRRNIWWNWFKVLCGRLSIRILLDISRTTSHRNGQAIDMPYSDLVIHKIVHLIFSFKNSHLSLLIIFMFHFLLLLNMRISNPHYAKLFFISCNRFHY